MSTCKAEVLFGHNDRDHGGILFKNRIAVYENSVTRLVFESRASRDGKPGDIEAVWIPNPNYLVECCMLMAAVYGMNNAKIQELANKHLQLKERDLDVNLCKVNDKDLFDMFAATEQVFCFDDKAECKGHRWKFIYALFQGSSLELQISNLKKYDIDMEVLKSVFSCEYSEWAQKTVIRGSL